mmetsp:Transcript_102800/g.235804  ORF Transcript_102800/g.235804 Transcript_102800/m.235804 type:complete len:230 (+) Transcript_102800:568-1257(+)
MVIDINVHRSAPGLRDKIMHCLGTWPPIPRAVQVVLHCQNRVNNKIVLYERPVVLFNHFCVGIDDDSENEIHHEEKHEVEIQDRKNHKGSFTPRRGQLPRRSQQIIPHPENGIQQGRHAPVVRSPSPRGHQPKKRHSGHKNQQEMEKVVCCCLDCGNQEGDSRMRCSGGQSPQQQSEEEDHAVQSCDMLHRYQPLQLSNHLQHLGLVQVCVLPPLNLHQPVHHVCLLVF